MPRNQKVIEKFIFTPVINSAANAQKGCVTTNYNYNIPIEINLNENNADRRALVSGLWDTNVH